ncbi:MAG TPA: hypothetical protein VK586_27265 [Streptosporangiaceae bacterium]|nr:hypothetical protein [Streptosporangiaceae bacterium]
MPQPAHSAASSWCRQRAHSPPPAVAVSGQPPRPQRPHDGSAKVAEPRAISSVTSRPTAGGAPCASARESEASAADTSRSACGLVITASIAAATTVTGKDPSAAATWAATWVLRQSGQGRRRPAPPSSCPAPQTAAT